MQEETRVVDAATGGEKGQKLARFSLIPFEMLWELARHYGRGAKKYADRNWERGYKWSLSYDALNRHLNQWCQGEDDDPETGTSHLIAVIWHATALFIFHRRGLGTDDLRLEQDRHDPLCAEGTPAGDQTMPRVIVVPWACMAAHESAATVEAPSPGCSMGCVSPATSQSDPNPHQRMWTVQS